MTTDLSYTSQNIETLFSIDYNDNDDFGTFFDDYLNSLDFQPLILETNDDAPTMENGNDIFSSFSSSDDIYENDYHENVMQSDFLPPFEGDIDHCIPMDLCNQGTQAKMALSDGLKNNSDIKIIRIEFANNRIWYAPCNTTKQNRSGVAKPKKSRRVTSRKKQPHKILSSFIEGSTIKTPFKTEEEIVQVCKEFIKAFVPCLRNLDCTFEYKDIRENIVLKSVSPSDRDWKFEFSWEGKTYSSAGSVAYAIEKKHNVVRKTRNGFKSMYYKVNDISVPFISLFPSWVKNFMALPLTNFVEKIGGFYRMECPKSSHLPQNFDAMGTIEKIISKYE